MRQALHRVVLGLCAACIACAACAACASTPAARPESSASAAVSALPEDPLALIIEDPESIATVRVRQLKSSPLFERLRPHIERATCFPLAEWDALLSATERAVLAARQKPEQAPEWLAVLDGRYTEADGRRLLDLAVEKSHSTGSAAAGDAAKQAPAEAREGRFAVTARAGLAVSTLESKLIVLGSEAWVRAALAAILQPVAKFSDSALWRVVGAQLACSERTACLLSTGQGASGESLERGLSGAGAKELGQHLKGAGNGLGATLRDGLGLGFAAQLDSAQAAQDAERGLRQWLWQTNLVVRLTGMPAVLDQTRLSTQDSMVRAELDVSQADVEAYESRARGLLERALPSCNAQSL
jgi:hypothetical protein